MTDNIRPTVTTWGDFTARFLEPEATDDFMRWLAEEADTILETEDRKDGADYWFADGAKLLDFLAACDPATVELPEEIEDARQDATCLLQNMRQLAPAWRANLRDDGSLNLFSD